MTTTIAELGLRVDSSQPAAAAEKLDDLAMSAARAQAAEIDLARASAVTAAAQSNAATAAQVFARYQGVSAQQAAAAALSTRQLSFAMRQLPAQITDVVTQLASGQPAWQVFIQQGGQVRDMFGGFSAAGRALLTILTPLRLGLIGLAGGAVAVMRAFAEGQREAFALNKAIILTGSSAGVTAIQVARMAAQIAEATDATRRESTRALVTAINAGGIAADQLAAVARIATELQRLGGPEVEETIKLFAELGRQPVQAAEKLQRQYNFLTLEILEQIRALEHEGRTAEAAAVAQSTLIRSLDQRIGELRDEVGLFPRIWNSIATAASKAWDAMLGVGRPEDPAEELRRLQTELRLAEAGFDRGRVGGEFRAPADPEALRARIAALRAEIAAAEADAKRAADNARALEREALDRALSQVRADAAARTFLAQLESNRADAQRSLSAMLEAQASANDVLEGLRRAGIISETEYYDARRELIDADRAARVQALETEMRLLDAQRQHLLERREEIRNNTSLTPEKALEAHLAIEPQLIALETRRRDVHAEIGRITAEASRATAVLGLEQQEALRQVRIGFESAQAAAEDYLAAIQRRNQLELEGIGRSEREREALRRRADIEIEFERKRQELERDRRRNPQTVTPEVYERELRLIEDTRRRALEIEEQYQRELEEKRGSFYNGAIEALRTYADESRDVAGQVAAAFGRGLDEATDELVRFVRTGKANFSDLIDSIINDMLRLQLKQSIATVFSWLFPGLFGPGQSGGSLFGGLFGGGNRGTAGNNIVEGEWDWWDQIFGRSFGWPRFATGTPFVDRTGPAIVHEGEAIIPASMNPFAGRRGMGPNITINQVNHFGPGANVAEISAELDRRDQQIKADVIEYLARERNTHPLSRKF